MNAVVFHLLGEAGVSCFEGPPPKEGTMFDKALYDFSQVECEVCGLSCAPSHCWFFLTFVAHVGCKDPSFHIAPAKPMTKPPVEHLSSCQLTQSCVLSVSHWQGCSGVLGHLWVSFWIASSGCQKRLPLFQQSWKWTGGFPNRKVMQSPLFSFLWRAGKLGIC